MNNNEQTVKFSTKTKRQDPKDVILTVYDAMQQKGYDPITQVVGYLISGDPTYITSHNNARYLIRQLERNELVEELLKFYIAGHE